MIEMKSDDQKTIESFLSDFVNHITAEFPTEIDYILLAGSAARGDFVCGQSDLDLGIRVKKQDDVETIREKALDLFWKLNEKHGVKFDLLSEKNKSKKPFSVYGPLGRTKQNNLFSLLEPLHGFNRSLLVNTAHSGKILYGRNIMPELIERAKPRNAFQMLNRYSFILSLLNLPLFFISPDKALSSSIRKVISSFEDRIFSSENDHDPNVVFAKKALHAKKHFDEIRKQWSYLDKFLFCFRAPIAIAHDAIKKSSAYYSRKK